MSMKMRFSASSPALSRWKRASHSACQAVNLSEISLPIVSSQFTYFFAISSPPAGCRFRGWAEIFSIPRSIARVSFQISGCLLKSQEVSYESQSKRESLTQRSAISAIRVASVPSSWIFTGIFATSPTLKFMVGENTLKKYIPTLLFNSANNS